MEWPKNGPKMAKMIMEWPKDSPMKMEWPNDGPSEMMAQDGPKKGEIILKKNKCFPIEHETMLKRVAHIER